MYRDDGNRFWREGEPGFLERGCIPPEQWALIPKEVKAQLLASCRKLNSGSMTGVFSTEMILVPACAHCGEPIFPHERTAPIVGALMHYECGARLLFGSVGHQRGFCDCTGHLDLSEVGLSRREAARRALAFYNRH